MINFQKNYIKKLYKKTRKNYFFLSTYVIDYWFKVKILKLKINDLQISVKLITFYE